MKTVTLAGGNMFQLAATELGDATQWIRIAQLNNLVDPWLIGTTTLRIPERDMRAGGGVAAQ